MRWVLKRQSKRERERGGRTSLAGVTGACLWLRVGLAVLLLVRGQLDALLVHALGLDALDQAEEVLIRNRGCVGTGVWRRTPLVVYPGGLHRTRQETKRKQQRHRTLKKLHH